MKRKNPFCTSFDTMRLGFYTAVVVVFAMAWLQGCASAPPARTDVGEILSGPQDYRNERVELTGNVLDFDPARGDTYRTLDFLLGYGEGERIRVFYAGYTAEAISKASALVGKAYEKNEPVTVVGKVRVEKNNPDAVPELKLESVEYGGEKVNVGGGPSTRPGFSVGGWYFTPSVGVGVTLHP